MHFTGFKLVDRNLKTTKFNSGSLFQLFTKFPPTKITRYTVCNVMVPNSLRFFVAG